MQSKIAEERFAGVCCMRLTIEQVDDVIGEWGVKWAGWLVGLLVVSLRKNGNDTAID